MKTWPAIAATLVIMGALAACGGSDDSAYCDELKDFESKSESIQQDADDPSKAMEEVSSMFDKLADKAPSEIEDEWDTLSSALSGDLDMSGEDADDQMDPEKLEEASDTIAEHAKDKCDVDLNKIGE